MCSIEERVRLANRQYYTLEDTRKIMGVSYKSLKPGWDEFIEDLKDKGIRAPRYGIKAETVRNYFGIDLDQLMREYNFETQHLKQKNGINA